MPIRPDDTPEVLKQRLTAYRAQTAPLTAHYAKKGQLKTVDGMAPIEEVTAAIGRTLADSAFGAPKRGGKAKKAGAAKKAPAGKAKGRAKAAQPKAKSAAKSAAKERAKARFA